MRGRVKGSDPMMRKIRVAFLVVLTTSSLDHSLLDASFIGTAPLCATSKVEDLTCDKPLSTDVNFLFRLFNVAHLLLIVQRLDCSHPYGKMKLERWMEVETSGLLSIVSLKDDDSGELVTFK